jgi:hypothetical protein
MKENTMAEDIQKRKDRVLLLMYDVLSGRLDCIEELKDHRCYYSDQQWIDMFEMAFCRVRTEKYLRDNPE